MRGHARKVAVAGISALALLTAACGGGDGDGGGDAGGGGEAAAGGELVVNGCNPENPLVAGNTAETCGGNVLNLLTAGLIHYNPDTAEAQLDIAESIETDDNKHFTVKLKQGYMFHDGTEVKAHNFVDAWNYTAYGPNGQQGSYFMSPIAGIDDVACVDEKCEKEPKAKTLSGLEVVDDYTFTITTGTKVSNLKLRLGYAAFMPQPDSFFEDVEAFGEAPVGAGPYKFEKWDKNQQIVLSKFDDYSGEYPGKADKITFKIFQDTDSAYAALLGGAIDVVDTIPANAMIDGLFKEELQGKFAQRETSYLGWIGMNPEVDKSLADEKVRRAISMAIDRDLIIEEIYNGTYTAATGWVSPVVSGFKPDVCGESCVFDPAKAKAMLEEAGGYDQKLTLTYNGDGGHKEWTEAACNSITNTLGIECVATPTVDFATFLTKLGENKMEGMFRMAWVMDYPSIENYLGPIYGKGASSNYFAYKSEEFNSLLTEAAAAPTTEEANALYQEAEAVLSADFPTIPLWYGVSTVGWGPDVDGEVKITPFGHPSLRQVAVTS